MRASGKAGDPREPDGPNWDNCEPSQRAVVERTELLVSPREELFLREACHIMLCGRHHGFSRISSLSLCSSPASLRNSFFLPQHAAMKNVFSSNSEGLPVKNCRKNPIASSILSLSTP